MKSFTSFLCVILLMLLTAISSQEKKIGGRIMRAFYWEWFGTDY